MNSMTSTADMTMRELLARYPWARRALFQKFHIGGCASCGFSEEETLAAVCQRNGEVDPEQLLEAVHSAHEQDEAMMLEPETLRDQMADFTLVDIRTREEFDAVKIPGSLHFDQALMSEIMNTWPRDRKIVVVDHQGQRSLDAAAYFAGHGFSAVRCLRGGIDNYSEKVDTSLPRYRIEQEAA